MENLDLTYGIMIAILVPLLVALPIIYGKIDAKRKSHQSTKALNQVFRGIMVACVLLGAIMIAREIGIYYRNKQIAKGPTTGSLKKSDIAPGISLLEFCNDSPQIGAIPVMMPTNKSDSFNLLIILCNKGELPVYELVDKIIFLYDSSGILNTVGKGLPPALNKNTIIRSSEGVKIIFPVTVFPKEPIVFKNYFCFIVNYRDWSGQKQLEGIYRIHLETLQKIVTVPNSAVYDTVQKFLVSKKIL